MYNHNQRPIAILAAMEKEIRLLKKAIIEPELIYLAGVKYFYGKIGNTFVVVGACGEGKVSAAISCQAVIDRWSPKAVINTGCAGAISSDIAQGDIVISNQVAQWDIDWGSLGHHRGYIFSLQKVLIDADKRLVNDISKLISLEHCVHQGLIVSGDTFVDSVDARHSILTNFPSALCAEMEGASIGQVCAQNNVPFCIVRCISDSANNESKMDLRSFSKLASEISANKIISFLKS